MESGEIGTLSNLTDDFTNFQDFHINCFVGTQQRSHKRVALLVGDVFDSSQREK
jgi:hypothetical protein